MQKILFVESSPRLERSHSRTLAREFIAGWQKGHPEEKIIRRDVARTPPGCPTEEWVAAAYGFVDPDSERTRALLRESDELIAEFVSADRYVITAPMHNFHVPAALKAYIDNVVRPTKTFTTGPEGYKGLIPSDRKVLIITARGGAYQPGTPWAAYDHQEPWLRTILGFVGLKDLTFVHAQGINLGDDVRKKTLADARQKLQRLLTEW
jgi:FMN-dependent NADH-azoreductase